MSRVLQKSYKTNKNCPLPLQAPLTLTTTGSPYSTPLLHGPASYLSLCDLISTETTAAKAWLSAGCKVHCPPAASDMLLAPVTAPHLFISLGCCVCNHRLGPSCLDGHSPSSLPLALPLTSVRLACRTLFCPLWSSCYVFLGGLSHPFFCS